MVVKRILLVLTLCLLSVPAFASPIPFFEDGLKWPITPALMGTSQPFIVQFQNGGSAIGTFTSFLTFNCSTGLTCTASGSTITATASGATGTVTVVDAGNLTSTALVTGGGSQALQTPALVCGPSRFYLAGASNASNGDTLAPSARVGTCGAR